MRPGLLNKQHDKRTISWALALRDSGDQFRPHDMRDIQGFSSVFFLLMLTEKYHVHEKRVNHIQVPNAREKSLPEDAMKDVQKGRQLLSLLLRLGVNLQSAVRPERLLVSRRCIAMRTKANWVLKTVIFNPK